MRERLPLLDSLRGLALILMTGYHFGFDLHAVELIQINFQEGLWPFFRYLILFLFLGISGASLAIGTAEYSDKAFQRKILRLLGGALIISFATIFLFHDQWVFFGVLHFLLAATLLAPSFAKRPRLCAILTPMCIFLPLLFRLPETSEKTLALTGLAPYKPSTVDLVPLLPWIGIITAGACLGHLIKHRKWKLLGFHFPALSWLGRRSLAYYLGHQAILLPIAWLLEKFLK